jgi:hypothetical protein
MKAMLARTLLIASILAAGCETPGPAPSQPTWAEDVLPILQGNCFSCHGPTANYNKYRNKRWDAYDRTAEPYVRLGFGNVEEPLLDADGKPMLDKDGNPVTLVTTFGAKDDAALISAYIDSDDPIVRMPPPPATKLSARDILTIKNWIGSSNPKAFALGSHQPNHKATIAWLDKRARRVVVADEDGDPVVGKLDCSGTEVSFDHSGAFTLASAATLPCTGSLYDGFDETTVNLK